MRFFPNWFRVQNLVRYFSRGAVPIDGTYVEPRRLDRVTRLPRTPAEPVRIPWVAIR